MLLLGARPKCRQCLAKVGLHWLAVFMLSMASSVLVVFFGLYLLSLQLPVFLAIAIFLVTALTTMATAAFLLPLETKGSWFEP